MEKKNASTCITFCSIFLKHNSSVFTDRSSKHYCLWSLNCPSNQIYICINPIVNKSMECCFRAYLSSLFATVGHLLDGHNFLRDLVLGLKIKIYISHQKIYTNKWTLKYIWFRNKFIFMISYFELSFHLTKTGDQLHAVGMHVKTACIYYFYSLRAKHLILCLDIILSNMTSNISTHTTYKHTV